MSAEETKEVKLSFGSEKNKQNNEVFPVIDQESLTKALSGKKDSFPLLNNGDLEIHGTLGKTGVVLTTSHNGFDNIVVASLPHPRTRLKEIDPNGEVIFGGQPTNKALEEALEIPIGGELAAKRAKIIIEALKMNNDFSELSLMFNGMGAVGSEPEAWVIDPQTGDLVRISGGELQAGLLEVTLEAISNPGEFLRRRAEYVIKRAQRFPNFLTIDTSVLPTSIPLKPEVNTGHDLGPYVLAIQRFLWKNYFSFTTPEAVEISNQLAQSVGFSNIQELHQSLGHMAYWVMAASHASVGLHHLRTGNKALWVPAEWAIAVSDVFNSDLATAAEFLMFSTPIIYSQTPTVKINGSDFWPNDYRAILRYLMDTTNPGPFIENPHNMYERIIYSIVNGITHTMDRGSYLTEINGKLIPIAHGKVRNRISSTEPRNLTGRVEFTGCGASPSIIDEVARNCFLQILMIGAMEAVTNGQTPQEYFGQNFPSIASWEKQKDLAIKTSLFGFNYQPAKELIEEATQFIIYISNQYPALELQAKIATNRLRNLLSPAVDSLKQYLENPQGSISEVLKNELRRGVDPLELARKIHQYQLDLSGRILTNPFYWIE